ncbi:MAG TPA: metallophosphoesterase family protein [Armatimonadota bacterium]|jgi:3',5'-cyclic AMP phosphodiesterase CpdA
MLTVAMSQTARAAKPELEFREYGAFKVMMYSDIQDGPTMDPRATALMGRLLDAEKPDVVIIGGDCIAGDTCKSVADVKQAIAWVARPVEERKIPWAMVFGNHDQEHFPNTHMGKEEVFKVYQSYPYNINVRGSRAIHGVGNANLLVKDHTGKDAVFSLWLLDSNEYVDGPAAGYDWIHSDQIAWYTQTSRRMEARYGHKIPGLMFFHIPLCEFTDMAKSIKIKGDRGEDECPARVNSGLLAAVLERGDVKGIFCGHDHVNNYVGDWLGIQLGYDGAIGYYSYNRKDDDPKVARGRGARVFQIRESDPWKYTTWMRFSDNTTE